VNVGGLLPIPDVSNQKFPEARIHEERGLHRVLFRFSPEDYTRAGEIWNGPHPEDGQELTVSDDIPEGAPWPDLDEEPQLSSPGVDPDMMKFFAAKLGVVSDDSDDAEEPLTARAVAKMKKMVTGSEKATPSASAKRRAPRK
jgi:Mn-containing catalase